MDYTEYDKLAEQYSGKKNSWEEYDALAEKFSTKAVEEEPRSEVGVSGPTTVLGALGKTAVDIIKSPITLASGLLRGAGNEADLQGFVLNKMAQSPTIPLPGYMQLPQFREGTKKVGEKLSTVADLVASKGLGPEHGFVRDVLSGIGEALPGLGKYVATSALGPANFAAWGGIEGYKQAEEAGKDGLGGAAKGALIGSLNDLVFRGSAKLLPSAWHRVATGLGFAGTDALNKSIESGKIEIPTIRDFAKNFTTGLGVSLAMPGKKSKEPIEKKQKLEIQKEEIKQVEPERESTAKDKGLSLEELARRQEVVLGEKGDIKYIGKLGDEGVTKIYGTPDKAYRPLAGKPGWEEFGKGPTVEVTDPNILKTLDMARPREEAPIPEISTRETGGEEFKTEKFKTVAPLPPAGAGATPIEPRLAPSQHALKVEQRGIKKGLLDKPGEVAMHEVVNPEEQSRMSAEIRNANPEAWKRMATGKEEIPNVVGADGVPLMGSSVFQDAAEWATKNKDVAFVRELAKSVPKSISRAGQELYILSEGNPESPVVALTDINRTIAEANKVRKEIPRIKDLEDSRLRLAGKELESAISKHDKQLSDLAIIWQRKKLNRYSKKLGERGEKTSEKLINADYTKDPRFATWLDQQTKLSKQKVDRLQKTFNKLKEMNDRRTSGVSDEEAANVVDLSDRVSKAREGMDSGGDRMEYGRSWVDFHEYVNDLKFRATKQTFREAIRRPGNLLIKGAGISKAIKASFDNSYIFRQGFKAALRPATHKIWRANATKSFNWAWQQFGGKHVMRELMADIVSRPNYINGKMTAAKLAFGNPEEPFPSHVPEGIPFFGKFYKASETAFAGQAYKNRADIFDKFIEIAERSGVSTNDKVQLKSIGRLVNSLTGRGRIGSLEKNAELVNNVFFSLRFLKSNIDFLTAHRGQGETAFVKKQAGLNLLSAVMGTAAVLGIAKALKSDSVDFDPRSANFGKIKIGNTRFDITGGMGSIITLAARLLSWSTKSSVTGKTTKLNEPRFGAMTAKDVIYNFFENKTAPAVSVALSLVEGRDRLTRKPPRPIDVARNLLAPLPVSNAEELLRDPESAPFLLGIILDSLGIGTNTYGGKIGSPTSTPSGIDYDKLAESTKQ